MEKWKCHKKLIRDKKIHYKLERTFRDSIIEPHQFKLTSGQIKMNLAIEHTEETNNFNEIFNSFPKKAFFEKINSRGHKIIL